VLGWSPAAQLAPRVGAAARPPRGPINPTLRPAASWHVGFATVRARTRSIRAEGPARKTVRLPGWCASTSATSDTACTHDERLPGRRPRTTFPAAEVVLRGCAVGHQPSVGAVAPCVETARRDGPIGTAGSGWPHAACPAGPVERERVQRV
jgi:hypothetical protein